MPPEDLTEDSGPSAVNPQLVLYIKHLDDTVANYRRFFNSLLVKGSDHETLFRDLRHFREQEEIVALLTREDSEGACLKGTYQKCNDQFLASRFAYPWCRNEYGKTKGGFLNTASSRLKQAEAKKREDDRFHKLLVPIWIAFRRRMMPTEEELSQFLEKYESKEEERRARRQQQQEQQQPAASNRVKYVISPEDDDETKDLAATNTRAQQPSYFNAEAFVSEEDDLVDSPVQQNHAQQAGGLFVGIAAASFLANNKRARKYIFKKLNK